LYILFIFFLSPSPSPKERGARSLKLFISKALPLGGLGGI